MFSSKALICFHLKKSRTFININNTHFKAYTYLGSENIGQKLICLIITCFKSFSFIMLNRLFCCSFWLFYDKISCLSVCGETTTNSTAICDISKEREFNYLLHGIKHMLTKTSTTDVCVILPPNLRGQNIKLVPIFSLLTSHFMFSTYQSCKRSWCGWDVGCTVGGSSPCPTTSVPLCTT